MLLLLLTLVLPSSAMTEGLSAYPVVPQDTTYLGEDNDEEEETVERTRQNKASGLNAMDYILENRYIPTGETFSRRWTDHLFGQIGIGAEQMEAPTKYYKVGTLTSYHAAVGWQFSPLHSVRLMMHGSSGYQQSKDLLFYKYAGRLEYLYSLSTYFSGYNPTRLMEVSALLGVGAQYSRRQYTGESGSSFEGHAGAQFKFYTGPHAYIALEPYLGFGGDDMDLSGNRNWRKTDIFYGVNVGMVYYLRKNLSPESRSRIIGGRHERNGLSVDSLLQSWQQPWFLQVSTGAALMESPRISVMETLGSEISLAAGKWLSPVIGFRTTVATRQVTWNKQVTPPEEATYRPQYTTNLHNVYVSGRLEAMLNPLGFLGNFSWDARMGFFLVGGAEMGWLLKTQSQKLSCRSEAYGAGVNLWYRVVDGLKVFVEPRFAHCVYRIPYTNVDWNKRFSDNSYTINAGFTLEMYDQRRWPRDYKRSYEYEFLKDPLRKITVGLGGGTHLLQTRQSYDPSAGMGYNAQLYGEYNFSRVSAARLSLEYVTLKRSGLTDYTDYNMDYPEEQNAPVGKRGLWNHHYNIGLVSLAYMANVGQLFAGEYHETPFRFYAFGGPTAVLLLSHSSQLSPQERLMQNHQPELNLSDGVRVNVGGHVGLKLFYRLSSRIGLQFTPVLYVLGNADLPGIDFLKVKFVETLNAGVQIGI